MPTSNKYPLLTLTIELLEMPYPVKRVVDLRAGTSMRELHHIIQAVMPWGTGHLYEFSYSRKGAAGNIQIGDPLHWDGEMSEENDDQLYYVEDLFQKTGDKINYIYDMGDYWKHSIELTEISNAPLQPLVQPFLVEAHGSCPPEDCGGPHGFLKILEIVADKEHPEHGETMDWLTMMKWSPKKFSGLKLQRQLNKYKETMWKHYIG